MPLILILLLYIAKVTSMLHEKSFLSVNSTTLFIFFTVDDQYIFTPVRTDIIQRSFNTSQVVRTLRGHSSNVADLFIFNNTLVSASDGEILYWDLKSGSIIKRLQINCFLFSINLFKDTLLVSCQESVMIDETGVVLRKFEALQKFYVFGDVFYGFSTHTGVFEFMRNFTQKNVFASVVSAVIRNGDALYVGTGGGISFSVTEVSLVNGASVLFSGNGHTAWIHSFLIVENYLFSGGEDRLLIQWDLIGRKQLNIVNCGNSGIVQSMLPYNSTVIYVGDGIGSVLLCEYETGKTIKVFTGQQNTLVSLAVTDDFVYSGSHLTPLKVWSTVSGEQQSSSTIDPFVKRGIYVISNSLLFCFFSISVLDLHTGAIIKDFGNRAIDCTVLYYNDGLVYVPVPNYAINKYNLTTEALVLQFSSPYVSTVIVDIVSIGHDYFFTSHSNMIAEWDLNNGQFIQTFSIFSHQTYFTSYESILFAAGHYIFVQISVSSNPTTLSTVYSYQDDFYTVLYDGSIGTIFAGGVAGIIYGFDTVNGFAKVYELSKHAAEVEDLALQGDFIFSCSIDGTVKQWSLVTKRIVFTYEDKLMGVSAVLAFDNFVVFGTDNGTIFKFDIESDFLLNYNFASLKAVTGLTLSNDSLFISGKDETITVLDRINMNRLNAFDTSTIPYVVRFYQMTLYSGNADFTIVRWNYTSGFAMKTYYGHDAVINDIIFVGKNMFSAGSDQVICLWDLDTFMIFLRYRGHTDQVTSLAICSSYLCSASLDKSIIVWNIQNAAIVKILKRTISVLGHVGPINQITYCYGSLFSASSDLTIKQWDLETGTVFDTMFGHFNPVTSVYCYKHMLFSGSEDFSVLLWLPEFQNIVLPLTSSDVKYTSRSSSINEILQRTESFNFLYILIIVALLLFVLLLALVIKWRSYTKGKSESNKTTSDFSVTYDTTMFTQAIGMALPGYLEMQGSAFRPLKQIAKGGGGSVYIAEIFGKEGPFIAKIICEKYDQLSNIDKQSFDQEITIMEFLKQNKNIAKVVGFCRSPCCILMKYYAKGSFDGIIHSGTVKYSTRQLFKYLIDISCALQVVHSKSLVHSDLKPENILVDFINNEITLVLTDFGITQVLSDKFLAAQSFQLIRRKGLTVPYAAPEVFKRFRDRFDDETAVIIAGDIYSYGIIIYEAMFRVGPWSRR